MRCFASLSMTGASSSLSSVMLSGAQRSRSISAHRPRQFVRCVTSINPNARKGNAMSSTYETFVERLHELADIHHAQGLMSWDQETYMPPRGAATRARAMGTLAGLYHERLTAPELVSLVADLRGRRANRRRGRQRPRNRPPAEPVAQAPQGAGRRAEPDRILGARGLDRGAQKNRTSPSSSLG